MVDTNKKLPKHAWDDDEIVPKKGFTTGEQDILGSKFFKYASPSEPEKFSYQKTWASGSYETLQYDNSKVEIRTSLNPGEIRNYTAGGSSSQTDGHHDTNVESTSRINVMGDIGISAKTTYQTSTEGAIIAHNRFKKEFVVAASDSVSFNGSFGDQVNEHSGNWHESFEKDHVQAVTGNKITMVNEGDYAVHVQKGGFDAQVSEGKLHLMTVGDDLIANSNVKILLQVGSQAKITIDPSTIKLQVGGGSYIEITAGGIKMVSPRIDLN